MVELLYYGGNLGNSRSLTSLESMWILRSLTIVMGMDTNWILWVPRKDLTKGILELSSITGCTIQPTVGVYERLTIFSPSMTKDEE